MTTEMCDSWLLWENYSRAVQYQKTEGDKIMRKILTILVVWMIVCAMQSSALAAGMEDAYNNALELLSQGKYAEAAQAFDNMFGYEDANLYSTYAKALNAGESGDYGLAYQAFEMLGDFRDCAYQKRYYEARQYESYGDFWSLDQAKAIYGELTLFRDCAQRIEDIDAQKRDEYDEALIIGRQGAYAEAAVAFGSMNGFEDADDYHSYYSACLACQEGDYTGALAHLARLRALGDLENSPEVYAAYGDAFLEHLSVGDMVDFGWQPWYVLDIDRENKRLLVITASNSNWYSTYGTVNTYTTWENSRIREWMNDPYNGFMSSDYFRPGETDLIESTGIPNLFFTAIQMTTYNYPDSPEDMTVTGVTWEEVGDYLFDKVFALDVDETMRYMERVGELAQGGGYWLRDGGRYNHYNTPIYSAFSVGFGGQMEYGLHNTEKPVRPACWINLN